MKSSIASVTFRNKSIEEISKLAHLCGISAIEWGADIHVPPRDAIAARNALMHTKQNGLTVSAYGSYYRGQENESFEPVLEAALIIEAEVIRIWAGNQASENITLSQRQILTEHISRAVLLAKQTGCVVATEYHANTLTDTLESTLALLNDVPDLRTLWQPPIGLDFSQNVKALNALKGKIANLHVYHRSVDGDCEPLLKGVDDWRVYFKKVALDGKERYATLEFVKNNSEEQFIHDAAVLRLLLEK